MFDQNSDYHGEDDEEESESLKKIREICEKAIDLTHERIFMVDKKHPISTAELKSLMLIVREAFYMTADHSDFMFNDLSDFPGNDDENDDKEDDDKDKDDGENFNY